MRNEAIPPWLSEIAQYESAKQALLLIQRQYVDLAKRLNILTAERAEIVRKFGHDRYVGPIDENIRKLSALGIKLAETARRFFPALEPKMGEIMVAKALGKGLDGLRGFEDQVDRADGLPQESVDEIDEALEQAVLDLEQAINR